MYWFSTVLVAYTITMLIKMCEYRPEGLLRIGSLGSFFLQALSAYSKFQNYAALWFNEPGLTCHEVESLWMPLIGRHSLFDMGLPSSMFDTWRNEQEGAVLTTQNTSGLIKNNQ